MKSAAVITGLDDLDILVGEVGRDQKKIKEVIAYLYDPDMERRFLGARALGRIAEVNPSLIEKRWERLFNSFDDTMSCWGIAEALGEIARGLPGKRGRIVVRLRKFKSDECSCQGFLWAVGRIGQVDRDAIEHLFDDVIEFLDSENLCMAGQATWACGELGLAGTSEKLQGFADDTRELWLYENDAVTIKTMTQIAREAIEKLESLSAAYARSAVN